jgi:vitamin B12 transporter
MQKLLLAGAAGLVAACASASAHAQLAARPSESLVVTATRSALETPPTLRDAIAITRDDLDAAGPITLAEALQRFAGVELRATGGPGQPTGLFLRGASTAQTLVLVDGMRVASATAGTTAIEAIPLELIERIEVVKGPMSGLYGPDAIGGVVQVFTRGKSVPHLFGAMGFGSENDRRVSAGLSTVDDNARLSIAAGWRRVESRSATNPRVPFALYDPDRDPHENAYADVHAAYKLWTGEWVGLDAFASGTRTSYDGGSPADLSRQSLGGAKVWGTSDFLPWWKMRLAAGHARDRQKSEGGTPSLFETRTDQASFINDFRTANGTAMLGAEWTRQDVRPDSDDFGTRIFAVNERTTDSYFASVNEAWFGQRVEANVRSDHDQQYGRRTTGAFSYGTEVFAGVQATVTVGRGFRVPTFNDLYVVQFEPYYTPNPNLKPERSRSTEIALASLPKAAWRWRLTGFDNRLEDLITPTDTSVDNLARARIRGVEASVDGVLMGVRVRAQATAQRPRDEDTGNPLRMRAERYGSVDASRSWGAFGAGIAAVASGRRYDSGVPSEAARVGGFTRWDVRARYAFAKQWTAELTAVNVLDKRYETALGYDAPRRGAFLSLRFDAF